MPPLHCREMKGRAAGRLVALILLSVLAAAPVAAQTGPGAGAEAARIPGGPVALSALARPGHVLILRHAQAPGVGDPPGFKLDECASQRNLDDTGRAQALRLGERLAQAGVRGAKVWSSQWCRCLDTARLLKLGPVTPLPALNSFFGRSSDRELSLAALRRFLATLPVSGPPVVLVTHQVTITAMTGLGVASGEGALWQLNGTAEPVLLGKVALD